MELGGHMFDYVIMQILGYPILRRHEVRSAHQVGLMPDVFVDNATDWALRNLNISRHGPYEL